jgi:hypothetical protein
MEQSSVKLTVNNFPRFFRGRLFTRDDIRIIRKIVEAMHATNRAAISREVCRRLCWYRPNGQLKDAACRYVLLRLHRSGLIVLPPPKRNPFLEKKTRLSSISNPQHPIHENAGRLTPLKIELVTKHKQLQLWKEYIERYHYLGNKVIVGPQLKYLIACEQGMIACIGFGGAAWKVQPRDQWIGWTPEQRKRNLPLVINNVRFLILPWVTSKNLASMILARVSEIVPEHWQYLYGYKPVLMETFVEKERFEGTCYKAANWNYVGDTKGRGKMDRLHQHLNSIKAIFLYKLAKNAKDLLINPKMHLH